MTPFPAAPDHARLWVFGAAQAVLGADAEALIAKVEAFIRHWQAHGVPVVGTFDWRYDRFLLVGADEEASGVSGCSVDALFRVLKAGEGDLGVTLLDQSLVFFRDSAGTVQAVTRPEFRELVSMEEIGDGTIVFDNTVGTVGGVRRGEWERPCCESWHGRAFTVRK